ncbi:DEAD/DEAH box helicase [Flavilitoribacter nigricans]|nr:DEAD/DEAH box helicase [Flavilitoribacter nigricans]
MQFKELGFVAPLLEGLDAMGFETATPVQEQAIPFILDKKDVLACAQTGTGKTAAFLLPILNRLTEEPHEGIDTLILEPTRELAVQVDQQLEGFSYFTPVSSIAVYGGRDGQSMEQEKRALKGGADIIVATPGRLIAHINLGYVDLSTIKCLILDEADRMLDMGFIQDIRGIINKTPRDRQTLLFSATMPPKIRTLSKQIMNKYEEVTIAVSKPAEKIIQGIYEVEDGAKIPLVAHLLTGKKRLKRVLIFAGTKRSVKDLAINLEKQGMQAGDIHSDLDQSERELRLRSFKNGTLPIIVATDVLARGIDIKGIDVVINFDVPNDAEDYVHRIGRTARASASGVAITLVNRKDRHRFRRIEELMEMKVHRLPIPPELAELAEAEAKKKPSKGSGRGRGRGGSKHKGSRKPYKKKR